MKRFLCVLLSMLLLAGCFASCTVTINRNEPTETPEEPIVTDEVTTAASGDYLEPTEKELDDLLWMTFGFSTTFDSEAEDAVERAYAVALRNDGLYQNYTGGAVFADSEFIDTEEPDPRDLFFDGESHPAYAYLKTPAESVDRFMREIMNVEPDHEIEIYLDRDFPVIYYDNGYYYTFCDSYYEGYFLDIINHRVDAEGWDEVIGGEFDPVEEQNGLVKQDENGKAILADQPNSTWTIVAKIILIDGERYWSIKRFG